MTRSLIACYSWTGNTAKVAEAIAARLSADVEMIGEPTKRGALGSLLDVLFKRSPEITPAAHDASVYDLVIVGCPVWASHMASPMRSYLLRERGAIKRLAVFCTFGGAGGERAMNAMESLAGQPAVARLGVTEPDLKTGAWEAKVDAFVHAIQAAA